MRYRAKRVCIVGGVFLRAGEVFEHPPYLALPDHLEVLDQPGDAGSEPPAKAPKGKPPKQPPKDPEPPAKAPGPSLADLGEGEPLTVEGLTSDQVLDITKGKG